MDYISVGQIINTFGINGEIKLYPLTASESRFNNKDQFYIGENKIAVKIKKSRKDKNVYILKFQEFNNINEVLPFIKEYLYVDENSKIELENDEYFIHDLLGLKVYNKGSFIGVLENVIENFSNDIYVVKNGEEEHLIPAVKEFIKTVDTEKGIMEVNIIEGM